MDQTDIAVNIGMIAGGPLSAIFLKNLTGWSGWIAYPLGYIIGFIVFTILGLCLMELTGHLLNRKNKNDTN